MVNGTVKRMGRDHGHATAAAAGGDASAAVCPLCQAVLSDSDFAIVAHLRMHVRSREIDEEGKRRIGRAMSPRLDEALRRNGL